MSKFVSPKLGPHSARFPRVSLSYHPVMSDGLVVAARWCSVTAGEGSGGLGHGFGLLRSKIGDDEFHI